MRISVPHDPRPDDAATRPTCGLLLIQKRKDADYVPIMSPICDIGATVPTVQTPEERLGRVDQELEDLKTAFVDAVQELQRASEVDGSFDERWDDVISRIGTIQREVYAPDFDKDQVVELYQALLEIKDLLAAGRPCDLDTSDRLLICIERIRHVVRDALDEHVSGVQSDVGLVMADLDKWLPGTPDRIIAGLVDVDRRTLTRWKRKSGPPSRRLRIVASLIAILRHNWTPEGIVAWFYRPRRDLDGRKPIALLDDANYEGALISAARSSRSQYAS